MNMKRPKPRLLAILAIPAITAALLASAGGATAAEGMTDADQSVSSRSNQVKLPDLTGMTVAKAERRLRRLGLRPEAGTILTNPASRGSNLMRKTGRRSRTVTAQSPAAGWYAAKGDEVALGTAGGSGPMRVAALAEVNWRRVSFSRGVLTLKGLSAMPLGNGFCGVADHASVVGKGKTRRLRLWVARFKIPPWVRCMPLRRARMVPGRGWNRRTVGWPAPLEKARPGLPGVFAVPFERAVLQPDGRQLLVTYWHGACDALRGARFRRLTAARRIQVKLLFGRTGPADAACPAIAVSGATVLRLPWRAGPRTRFAAARRATGNT